MLLTDMLLIIHRRSFAQPQRRLDSAPSRSLIRAATLLPRSLQQTFAHLLEPTAVE